MICQFGQFQRARQTLLRLRHHFHGVDRAVSSGTQGLHGHIGQGSQQTVGQPFLGSLDPGVVYAPAAAFGRCGTAIDHRLGDRNQGNPVGDAVVHAHHQRRAALVMFNQVKLPQGTLHVQRRHGQFAQSLLQCFLFLIARFGRQRLAHHMVLDLEVRVLDPGSAGRILLRQLAKTRVFEKPLLDALTYRLVSQTGFDNPDTHDHHQIAGGVHTQPGCIHLAHALAGQAQRAADGVRHILLNHPGSAAHRLAGTVCNRSSTRPPARVLVGGTLGNDSGNHKNSRLEKIGSNKYAVQQSPHILYSVTKTQLKIPSKYPNGWSIALFWRESCQT